MARATKLKRASVGPSKTARELIFDYIKGNFFRVISVDGAFGGIAPTGRTIHMSVFSERRPLPRQTVHPLQADGSLGEEIKEKREGRKGLVREVEADLVMDLLTAIAVRDWLNEKIEQMIKLSSTSEPQDKEL